MTIDNLEKELKQEKLHSIYLFYGEETYLLENAVKKIKKIFPIYSIIKKPQMGYNSER